MTAAIRENWEMRQLDAHCESTTEYDYKRYKNLPWKEVNGEWVDRDGEAVDEATAIEENDRECERQDERKREADERFWRGDW